MKSGKVWKSLETPGKDLEISGKGWKNSEKGPKRPEDHLPESVSV